MITSQRIDEELRGVDGLDWITALRADTIRLLAEQGVIERSLFDERDLAEVVSPDFPDEWLIVCRNPLLAAERARKRDELLAATERALDEIVIATKRAKSLLSGQAKWSVSQLTSCLACSFILRSRSCEKMRRRAF
jgi:hypothetical protein